MSGYHQDLTTNIENSRNSLRRIATNDDTEFSRQSIVNLMEKFVKTVNVMDETILIPRRLMDRSVADSTDTIVPDPNQSPSKHQPHHFNGRKKQIPIHERLSSADLFSLYNMLNNVKTDLLWGRNNEEQIEEIEDELAQQQLQFEQNKTQGTITSSSVVTSNNGNNNSTTTTTTTTITTNLNEPTKGHVRRPSTASVASSNSTTTLSDSDSEISTENDSGIESECNTSGQNKAGALSKQYRKHLLGLYRCLEQMTDAANYLTARYQSDIGPV